MNEPKSANSQPLWMGRRLMVVPMDFVSAPELGLIPLRIDPGKAFGSGTHPTTQLCLMALERRLIPQATVVDIGTGTGVLAIAAAKLGAIDILAVDIDPEAVRVAQENIVANTVDKQIRVKQGSLADVLIDQAEHEPASLVIVNILAGIVEKLFHDGLATTIKPGGLLILSGLLPTQTPGIRACLKGYGFKQLAQEQWEDWVCILAERLFPLQVQE